jgi:hypothetical protein
MTRAFMLAAIVAPALALSQGQPAPPGASGGGTAAEARAMMERAVVALKANEADALARFQKGDGGFRDRDLYVFCIGPDGTWSAHPDLRGKRVQDWVTANGRAPAEEMFREAKEGTISEKSYLYHRPGATTHADVPKVTYFTRVGDQVCGVGYYP